MSPSLQVRAPDGTVLAVSEAGPATAPVTVVLAHGWCLDRHSWSGVVEPLVADHTDLRVVSVDLRGHGGSGRDHRVRVRGDRASIGALADDLAAVIDELAPTGRLVLAGHSMGGMAVMALAAARPDLVRDRVSAVALVSTAVSFSERPPPVLGSRVVGAGMRALAVVPPVPPQWVARLPAPLRRLAPRVAVGARLTGRLLFGEDRDPAQVRAAHTSIGRTSLRTVGSWYAALARLDESASLASLAGVPIRLLVGEHDHLTPARESRAIADALRRSGARDVDLEVVPGAGHMLPFERPQLLADRLSSLARDPR